MFWSRCVSCTSRMAVFSFWIALLTLFHLARKFRFSVGAVAPLRFKDVILIFALVLRFAGPWFTPWLLGLAPGVGCASPGQGRVGRVWPGWLGALVGAFVWQGRGWAFPAIVLLIGGSGMRESFVHQRGFI